METYRLAVALANLLNDSAIAEEDCEQPDADAAFNEAEDPRGLSVPCYPCRVRYALSVANGEGLLSVWSSPEDNFRSFVGRPDTINVAKEG